MIAQQWERLFRPGFRRLWAAGLLIPLIMGGVLVALVLMSFTREPYKPPELITANTVAAYERGAPVYFEDERLWVVRTANDEMIALYDVDPHSSCATPWWKDYEHLGQKGWFQDACRGSLYDLEGRCFGGPCEVGLSRFDVSLNGSTVVVNLTKLSPGPTRDDSLEPATASPE
jgi:nitrite reductase/ring-hydroxylating ferredoxin subunit